MKPYCNSSHGIGSYIWGIELGQQPEQCGERRQLNGDQAGAAASTKTAFDRLCPGRLLPSLTILGVDLLLCLDPGHGFPARKQSFSRQQLHVHIKLT